MPFEELYADLSVAVRLRIILWWILTQRLLQPLNSQFSQGLMEQLEDSWLIITLQGHASVTQTLDV